MYQLGGCAFLKYMPRQTDMINTMINKGIRMNQTESKGEEAVTSDVRDSLMPDEAERFTVCRSSVMSASCRVATVFSSAFTDSILTVLGDARGWASGIRPGVLSGVAGGKKSIVTPESSRCLVALRNERIS